MFIKKFTIPFFVFTTGACILIIEIVAIRILSPYFGNSIFTFSSVISVVLFALSLGYYVGGGLADKYPREAVFYAIIAAGGFCTLFLYLAGTIFLPSFAYALSIVWGPIISSLLFFFLQSFLLGMLSPFAIVLQKKRMEEIGLGSTTGQIFFWSTLGSIAGSLGAGFFLIPSMGTDKIMLSTGFFLLILGLFSGLHMRVWLKLCCVLLLSLGALFFITPFDLNPTGVLYQKDSLYQRITIYDGVYEDRPTRFLLQDRNPSAAAFLDSDELVYAYTKYYSLYQVFTPDMKQALVIGGGAYSIPKAILKSTPKASVDVVEIDPILFEIAKTYFSVPDNERLNNFSMDGRRLLHGSSKKYDMIFSDAYASFYSIPEHLTTQEFFKMAKEKLSDQGIFIANVIGSLSQKPQSFALSEMRTFRSVFDNSYFFAVESRDSAKVQNIIFVGYNGSQKFNFDTPQVKKNKNEIISGLSGKMINVDEIDFFRYPILTDNFAPVDYLISKEFENMY